MDNFDVISNYDGSVILDTNLETHSKIGLFFTRIISCLLSCFGYEVPDCDMGNVANKIHTLVSDQQLFNGKTVAELESFVEGITRLKQKFDKTQRDDKTIVLNHLDEAVNDVQLLKIPVALNELPAEVEESITISSLNLGGDYRSTEDGDLYFNRRLEATYQFGNDPNLLKFDPNNTESCSESLTKNIKSTFGRSQSPVMRDPLLKLIFRYLGPNGLSSFNADDISNFFNQKIMVGGSRDQLPKIPPQYQFIPEENPNEATIVTKSPLMLTKTELPNNPLFFLATHTISLIPNDDTLEEYTVIFKRQFEPL